MNNNEFKIYKTENGFMVSSWFHEILIAKEKTGEKKWVIYSNLIGKNSYEIMELIKLMPIILDYVSDLNNDKFSENVIKHLEYLAVKEKKITY